MRNKVSVLSFSFIFSFLPNQISKGDQTQVSPQGLSSGSGDASKLDKRAIKVDVPDIVSVSACADLTLPPGAGLCIDTVHGTVFLVRISCCIKVRTSVFLYTGHEYCTSYSPAYLIIKLYLILPVKHLNSMKKYDFKESESGRQCIVADLFFPHSYLVKLASFIKDFIETMTLAIKRKK